MEQLEQVKNEKQKKFRKRFLKMNSGPACTYDFTLKAENHEVEQVVFGLKTFCKKWCFQKEIGDGGYVHYQGRLSLKVKARMPQVKNFFTEINMNEVRLSITSNENRDNCFYVTKPESRVAGPWSDQDIDVPSDVRRMETLRPWQQKVVDSIEDDDERKINIIVDEVGDVGKTQLVRWLIAYSKGTWVPATIEKADDLMQWVGDMPKSLLYVIDIPRASESKNARALFSAIETIRSGLAYDHRYHARMCIFEKPKVWVFTNKAPDKKLLSADRWVFWKIENMELKEI